MMHLVCSYKKTDETPLPTPSYKYNSWMKDKKEMRYYTPKPGVSERDVSPRPAGYEDGDWEDEQKRLDREWYGNDEGYDDTNNPFSDFSEEYAIKKEKEFEVSTSSPSTYYSANHYYRSTG